MGGGLFYVKPAALRSELWPCNKLVSYSRGVTCYWRELVVICGFDGSPSLPNPQASSLTLPCTVKPGYIVERGSPDDQRLPGYLGRIDFVDMAIRQDLD